MEFPTRLTVRAIQASTGAGVADLSFVLILKASSKNDYYVGPTITDADGILEITRRDCEKAIRRAQQMFVMDYVGDLSSCGPVAELKLQPQDQIENMIRQYDSAPAFWGKAFDEPEHLMASLRKVRNAHFKPASLNLTERESLQETTVEIWVAEYPGSLVSTIM